MPFYEYECSNCGFRDEVLQKISDAPLKKCPKCGKSKLIKLISAPLFRLKGSGWYETDFKSDKENKRNLAGADKEESKSEAKSDAKDAKSDGAKSEGSKGDGGKSEGGKGEGAKSDSGSAAKSIDKSAGKPSPSRPAKRPARKPAVKKKARR